MPLHSYTQESDGSLKEIFLSKETDYFTHLFNICKNPPPGGWKEDVNFDILEKRLTIIGKLKPLIGKLGKHIELEDDYHKALIETAKTSFSWLITSQDVLDFHNWLRNPT